MLVDTGEPQGITSLDGYAIALAQCVEPLDVLDIEAGLYRSLSFAIRTGRMRPGRNTFFRSALRMCEARRQEIGRKADACAAPSALLEMGT